MDDDQNSPWQYKHDANGPDAPLPEENDEAPSQRSTPSRPSNTTFSWEALEFIEHPHPPAWYAGLVAGTAVLTTLVYLATKDFFATGIVIVVGIIVGVFAGHKPSQVKYEIDQSGLSINGKNYPYQNFKSFALLHEGSLSSVNLMPLKRFAPPVSAYFQPADEEKIMDTIGNYLPYEDRKMDSIDRLSRRLHL